MITRLYIKSGHVTPFHTLLIKRPGPLTFWPATLHYTRPILIVLILCNNVAGNVVDIVSGRRWGRSHSTSSLTEREDRRQHKKEKRREKNAHHKTKRQQEADHSSDRWRGSIQRSSTHSRSRREHRPSLSTINQYEFVAIHVLDQKGLIDRVKVIIGRHCPNWTTWKDLQAKQIHTDVSELSMTFRADSRMAGR